MTTGGRIQHSTHHPHCPATTLLRSPWALLVLAATTLALPADRGESRKPDEAVAKGRFKSADNMVEEIRFETSSFENMVVVKLGSRLTGNNSRSRRLDDRSSNYGDSLAQHAYLRIPKDGALRPEILVLAWERKLSIDIIYGCGEQPEDQKRLVFPGYAETNCEILSLTLKRPRDVDRTFRW